MYSNNLYPITIKAKQTLTIICVCIMIKTTVFTTIHILGNSASTSILSSPAFKSVRPHDYLSWLLSLCIQLQSSWVDFDPVRGKAQGQWILEQFLT